MPAIGVKLFVGSLLAVLSSALPLAQNSSTAKMPDRDAAAAAAPLLADPSFEQGLSQWVKLGRNSQLSAVPRGRVGRSVKLVNTSPTTSSVGITDKPRLTPRPISGHRYIATAWVRASSPGVRVTLNFGETPNALSLGSGAAARTVLPDRAWHEIGATYLSSGRGRGFDWTVTAELAKGQSLEVDEASARRLQMRWRDEFSRGSVDRENWTVLDHSNFGVGNREFQCSMDRPANVSVSRGALWITARREAPPIACVQRDPDFPQGRLYSSGHLNTIGRGSWLYGFYELRGRLPIPPKVSQGIWPAFWMRPEDGGLGEIDIVEAYGSRPQDVYSTVIHQNLHHDYEVPRVKPSLGMTFAVPGAHPSAAYHSYAVDWEERHIRWFVDDKLTNSVDYVSHPWISETFNKNMILRVNLAVGNRKMPIPLPDTTLPNTFFVDYVRIYQ